MTMVGSVQWELIEPLDDRSMYAEFLAAKGEGLHHVARGRRADYDEALDSLRAKGRRVLQAGFYNGVTFAYLSTDEDLGVITEIFDWPEGHAQEPDAVYPWTARTTRPPFRADHVGSLLRPPALLQARERRARPAASTATRSASLEDDAIREVVRRQEEVGLRSRHGRRVPPRVVAHGLHLPAGRRLEGGRQARRHLPQRGGRHRVDAGRAPRRRQARGLEDDLRRRLPLPP